MRGNCAVIGAFDLVWHQGSTVDGSHDACSGAGRACDGGIERQLFGGKTRGQGNLVRHGIAAIVVSDPYIRPQWRGCHCFSRLPSAYANRKAMLEYGEMDWDRKDIYIVYINTGEQDRSLFPGAGRLTSECSEHLHKALMDSSAVSAC